MHPSASSKAHLGSRPRVVLAAALAIGVSVGLLADTRTIPPRTERPVPFAVGESLTYDVSWSNYLTAGSVVTRVIEQKPSYNSIADYIVAEARPSSLIAALHTLYYKMDTLLDVYTLLSQRGSMYSEEGKRHRMRTTMFERPAGKVSFEFQTDKIDRKEFAAPAATQDGLAALYALRAIALKTGDRFSMPVTDNGEMYQVVFTVGPAENVAVPMGTLSGWRIAIAATDSTHRPAGKNMAIWISADARRLPLKMQADVPVGSVLLTLRAVR